MPSAVKNKTTAKPAAKAAPKTSTQVKPATKAAQAAAHQNRPAPAMPAASARPAQTVNVPATRAAAPPPAELNENLPAYMQHDANLGKERIEASDLEIPRLKLMQPTSPELQEYDGLRAGFFFHPAAEFIFDTPFKAVPLYYDKRYILWKPRDMGGGILARADDAVHWNLPNGRFEVTLDKSRGGAKVVWETAPTVAESGLANWGTENPNDPNSPPAATQMLNFLLAFPDYPDLMPAVLTFQRTSIRNGRRFLTKLKTTRAPLFGTVWQFASKQETRNNNDFFTIDVTGAGLVEDEELYHGYRQMFEQYSNMGLQIKDIEGLQTDADDDMAGDDGDGDDQPRI